MDIEKFLEVQYNDSLNPCYFTVADGYEMVFMNSAMHKKLQMFEPCFGKKCYEVVHNRKEPCVFCNRTKATCERFIEQRIFNPVIGSHQRAKGALIDCGGQSLFMTKYFISSTDERRAVAEDTFDVAMAKGLQILAFQDQVEAIESFLRLLGDFYSSELCYVYTFDQEEKTLQERYFSPKEKAFSHEGTQTPEEKLEMVFRWLEESPEDIAEITPEDGRFQCDERALRIFEKYNMMNVVMSKLFNKSGQVIGFIAMNNCTEPVYDRRLLVAVSLFITESFNKQKMLNTLKSLQDVDLLTGFYNRVMYAERVATLHHNPPKTLGVLFVNLNGLRKTNEYFGFEMGDLQIKKTALVLREFFPEDFYRISGDEFVGFICDMGKDDFEDKVNHLQRKLREDRHDSTFAVGHSWDDGRVNVSELVKVADTVMVINKQEFYFNSLNQMDEIKDTVMQDLFRAIAEDEFLVYLQPQINLNTREVVGAEALIRRFDKRNQRLVFPDNFIPLYEQNSLIRHVDLFMVRKVSQILSTWLLVDQELPISVNLSRVTLMEFGIVKTIADILDEYGVPHSNVVIEVTERIGLVENDVAATLVDEFKEYGFRLSLDDFGCAYSNIVTLSQIDVDEVKIDKGLVDNLISNPKNRIIVKNMLLMCNELDNIFTLAEGIETEEQADFLRSVHCHLGQGYLYSRPIPNEEFYEKYIKGLEKKSGSSRFQENQPLEK